MSGTRHNCFGPGITGRGPDIISRGPDIFISGPRPYSQWRSLGPDIKGRRPDIISQGPNLVSWGPNIINSGPRHYCFLFILKYYFSHSTQYNHLYDVPSQPPYNLVSTKWSLYHSPVYISYLSCVYDMLNEPCKKHKDWGNSHVSISDIGTETASSSTVLVHDGSRY